MRQLPCQYAYGQRQEFVPIRLRIRPRCWHYTATRTTPSLVPYYYLQTIIVPICMRSINQPIMPIRLRSTDRPIDELYIRPLLLPDARTVLLPNQTMTVLRLQSNRPNDCANTPAIQRPINKSSSECSTYYHYLMLAPHYHQN